MTFSKYVFIISLILLNVLVLTSWEVARVSAQMEAWTEPVNISHTPNGSWFPDLAVDSLGNIHVIWCETTGVTGGHIEQVYYSMWNGQSWTEPGDIVPPSPDIIRNAIAADQMGNLHMLFGGSVPSIGHLNLFYKRALVEGAWSAARWSAPHRISQSGSYMGDIAIDSKGTVHVIYDNRMRYDNEMDSRGLIVAFTSDIFYRHSTDGGQTWSYPVNLSPSPRTGSSRAQMEIDGTDTLHIAWDEGWDRLSSGGDPIYSNYTYSSDGGETWAPVTTVSYPESTNAQLTVGSDGNGGVMLVWRATSRDEIFYQWSSDGGNSWSPPVVMPGVFARPWSGPFDMYDMAADSAGHIHLVAVGREVPDLDAPLAVYHWEWDGISWSKAETIYAGRGFPEYPKIAISRGNQLHAVWFTRESLGESGNMEVWYSSSQSAAPYQTPAPFPTPTSTPTPAPLPSPTPTITPYPTLSVNSIGLPEGLYTESDEVLRLIIALSPVMLVILLVVVIRLGWFSKLFR